MSSEEAPAKVATEEPTALAAPTTEKSPSPKSPSKSPSPGGEGGLLPGEHWAAQEAPVEEDDGDSAFGDAASSTASITSTILEYRTIHGRRYHSEQGNAQYWMANDDQSNEALDINHHVLTLLHDGKLYLAPLDKDIQKAVDIGTGTGIWAMDFADEFPNAEIIGTDVSAIQPSWVPPNLQFQIDDCTQEWTFKENSLDYVHIRYLLGSILDWTALFKEAFRCLKPGGWVESHEISTYITSDDNTVERTSAMGQWCEIFFEAGRRMGRSFAVVEENLQRTGIEEAGFVNIEQKDVKCPIGPWPKDKTLKEVGQLLQLAILTDIEGTLLFTANNILGWSRAEIDVYAAHYRSEIRSPKHHGWSKQRAVWARKPL